MPSVTVSCQRPELAGRVWSLISSGTLTRDRRRGSRGRRPRPATSTTRSIHIERLADRGVALPGEPPERVVRRGVQPLTVSAVEECEAITDQSARSALAVTWRARAPRTGVVAAAVPAVGGEAVVRGFVRPGRCTGPRGRATARRAGPTSQVTGPQSRAAWCAPPMMPTTVGGLGGRGAAHGGRLGGRSAADGRVVRREQVAQRAGRDRRTRYLAAGQLPAERPVDRHGRRVQRRQRVPARRDRGRAARS